MSSRSSTRVQRRPLVLVPLRLLALAVLLAAAMPLTRADGPRGPAGAPLARADGSRGPGAAPPARPNGPGTRLAVQGTAPCEAVLPAAREPEPLSRVLTRIAATEPFRIEYWTDDDPAVLQPAGTPVELVAALAQSGNVMVRYADHPRCPGQWRIETVWVLPGGPANTRPATPSAPAPAPPKRAEAAPGTPDPGLSAYLRAHGFADKPAPASAPRAPKP